MKELTVKHEATVGRKASRGPWGLSCILSCCLLTAAHGAGLVEVEFRVEADQVPDGRKVHVTGNLPALGNWDPGQVELTRAEDGAWSTTLTLPMGTTVEYKYTLGAWITEALGEDGWVPGNHIAPIHGSTSLVTRVAAWKNDGREPEGGITGNAKYHRNVEGKDLLARDIVVWLPPGYDMNPDERYPVIYAHDGQNLFDPSTSFLGVDWGLDETATQLIETGALQAVIIVGIYNTIDRNEEYTNTEKGRAYMDFVVAQVKPMMDTTYRTNPDREHTSVMGSSAGGLVSFLLAWKYPDTFSRAACLSPAFLYGGPDHAVKLVRDAERPEADLRFYIDNGGQDIELRLQPGCDLMLAALKDAGYEEGQDFVWFQDPEAGHNEPAWSRRAWRPLTFLCGTE